MKPEPSMLEVWGASFRAWASGDQGRSRFRIIDRMNPVHYRIWRRAFRAGWRAAIQEAKRRVDARGYAPATRCSACGQKDYR